MSRMFIGIDVWGVGPGSPEGPGASGFCAVYFERWGDSAGEIREEVYRGKAIYLDDARAEYYLRSVCSIYCEAADILRDKTNEADVHLDRRKVIHRDE